ncbi:hypothetical protein AALO_G00117410 [Alosa alosa]|uniref:DUF6729 domain-containing protein n=1 Tax=Alosa alosa TaxID=278164 RepID=A0AAV6GWX3_9TELE|nr:hypothetical protein AALO_G00117410 [Alosa alosa]
MYAYPVFRRQSAKSTRILMAPSGEANLVKSSGRAERAKPKEEVLAEASTYVTDHGGDPTDRFLVLAHCQFQFGMYQGQRFRWLLENSLGYALYLVHSISKERAQATPLSENKQLFQQYTSHIREFTEELEKYSKKQEMQAKARETGDQGCLMVEFGDFQGRSMKEELFPTATSEEDDEELVSAASQCEAQLNTALATTVHLEACADLPPVAMPGLVVNQPPAELPSHWKDQLPPFQQEWIRHTLFKANPRTGKPELVAQLKLWWHPPQPLLIHTQPPASPDHFFCRPLFLWMPHKMWLFPVVCLCLGLWQAPTNSSRTVPNSAQGVGH